MPEIGNEPFEISKQERQILTNAVKKDRPTTAKGAQYKYLQNRGKILVQ